MGALPRLLAAAGALGLLSATGCPAGDGAHPGGPPAPGGAKAAGAATPSGRSGNRSALPAPVTGAGGAPRYVDVTAAAGLDRPTACGSPAKDHLLESVGSGAAFVDLTGDGLDDVFVLDAWTLTDRGPGEERRRILSRGRFSFYRNRGDGTFADETDRSGLGGNGAWGLGVSAGDIDGDGDLDLYVTCFGTNLLYRNRGDGTFEERAAAAGVAETGWSGGSAFFDADGDGDLDLYVSKYVDATVDDVLDARRTLRYKGVEVMVGPFGLPGGADRYFRNRGDGTFEAAGEPAGLVDRGLGYGLGVLAGDFDADGDQDLYVANDSNPNLLFRNEGAGRFSEIGIVSGAAFSADGAAQAGMGLATADADGDGTLDLFVTNFADDGSALYKGEGKLFFSDVSVPTALATLTYRPLSWGTEFLDFDQDGRMDLVIADGQIYPQIERFPESLQFRQPNLLLLNRGERFTDGTASAGPGFEVHASFRGLAVGDLENDGDPDLLFTRVDQPPLLLRYDGGEPSRWLRVAPDPGPGPGWIGARVDLIAGGRRQSRLIHSGGSFASQGDFDALFALGEAPRADKVLVTFPDGSVREFRDVPGGSILHVPLPARPSGRP